MNKLLALLQILIKETDENHKLTTNQLIEKLSEQGVYAHLNEAISKDPILKSKFNDAQLEQIANGENPDGFTWHHNEGVGKMQLVDFGAHGKSSHTGGRAMWGGGQDAR